MGSLHMTIQTAVLIETLVELGADVRWCSCNIFSTQDHAAAAIAAAGVPVFAWKGETLPEYWWCTAMALSFPGGKGPQLIVDDGGDATLLIHKGYRAEEDAATLDGTPESYEEGVVLDTLRRVLAEDKEKWHRTVAEWARCERGDHHGRAPSVPDDGAGRAARAGHQRERLVHQVEIPTTSTGCRESLADGIKRATDVMIAGKVVVVCGYGDVGQGCARSMRSYGARVIVTEIDPICALQAAMEGFEVKSVESALAEGNIYVTCTGNRDIITLEHMERMRDQAIVCNIGHFDNEIQMARLDASAAVKRVIKAPGGRVYVPRRPPDLRAGGGAPGEPRLRYGTSVVRSCRTRSRTSASHSWSCGANTSKWAYTACRSASTRRSPACIWTTWAWSSRTSRPSRPPTSGSIPRDRLRPSTTAISGGGRCRRSRASEKNRMPGFSYRSVFSGALRPRRCAFRAAFARREAGGVRCVCASDGDGRLLRRPWPQRGDRAGRVFGGGGRGFSE